jgi:hypothetical protein
VIVVRTEICLSHLMLGGGVGLALAARSAVSVSANVCCAQLTHALN